MKHLDEGAVQALLDGELPVSQARAAEAHLAACGPCAQEAAELRAARSTLSRALLAGDVTPPVAAAQMALHSRRARAERWGRETRRALLRAAVLVVLVAGAASAAVPEVRGWLGLAPEPAAPATPAAEVLPAEPVAPPPMPSSGVSILPQDGAVQVVLHGPARGLHVRTRLQAGGRAEVAATGAAASARFRTGPGRIEVSAAGPGEVVVILPREARAAVVEVDGRTLVAKDGDRLRAMSGAITHGLNEAEFHVGP